VSQSNAPKDLPTPVPGSPWRRAPPPSFPADWASSFGQDPFGLWCGINVAGVEHRLRWIPPGEFLMGSPESEAEREDDETQHRVTLTEGFWLAETTCSQEFWEVITGENTSEFKGAARPVEQVSWKDVQGFCEQLNEQIPELHARLPTEAEWEYAARAGTETAYWCGDELSPKQANYDGYGQHADETESESRGETVEVKSYEANPWGLYQVHGNLWEWCSDWYGKHEERHTIDPRGPETGEHRVIRGGSWMEDSRWLRAAFRYDGLPDIRKDYVGFRLAAGQHRRVAAKVAEQFSGGLLAAREMHANEGGAYGHERPQPPRSGMIAIAAPRMPCFIGVRDGLCTHMLADRTVGRQQRPVGQPLRFTDRAV